MVPYGFSALLYAPLMRSFSYRVILIFTMCVFGMTCFICAKATAFPQMLWARIIMGISAASIIPLGLMMIGDFFDQDIRGRLVGFFFGISFLASLLGIVVGGLFSWRWLFYVPGILSFFIILGLYFLRSDIMDHKYLSTVNYGRVFNQRRIANIFIFIAFVSLLYHGVQKWFGVYLSQVYSLDKLTISFIFILTTVAGFLGQMLGGYLSDKKGRMFACYLGLMGLAIATVFLAGQYSLFYLIVLLIVFSSSWSMGHSGISTVLTDFSDQDRPAIAGLNSSVRFVAGGIGFYLTGFMAEKNFSMMFFIAGILMFLLVFRIKKILA
mgnify:CR=1 FL=1